MKKIRITGPLVLLVLLLGFLPTLAIAANPLCGETVMSDVTLSTDMTCTLAELDAANSAAAIKVGADGITIDLAGHTLACNNFDLIYCAGQSVSNTIAETAIGIDFNGKTGVVVKSTGGRGQIWGFDRSIVIAGATIAKATVQDLLITTGSDTNHGSVDTGLQTTGIEVSGVSCPGAVILDGNIVERHRYGIKLEGSSCVKVERNEVRWNRGYTTESHGILLINSDKNTITNNWVDENGYYQSTLLGGGITLSGAQTTGNRLAQNTVTNTCGDGISARAGAQGNAVGNNSLNSNGLTFTECGLQAIDPPPVVAVDMAERNPVTLNSWRKNNECGTQNQNVPGGVCFNTVTTTIP